MMFRNGLIQRMIETRTQSRKLRAELGELRRALDATTTKAERFAQSIEAPEADDE